jgi:hypothetical protein
MKNVYFDVSGIALSGERKKDARLPAQRIRQIGTSRLLYGSDAPTPWNLPKDALVRWHDLPLTREEFQAIDINVAPYLRNWLASGR